ncbi:MAG: two-component system regulatory protein YycI [Bacillota bacterium]
MERRGSPLLDEVLQRSEDEALVTLADKLEQVGLELRGELPTEASRMYSLKLTRHQPDVEQLRQALFPPDAGEAVIIGGRLSGHQTEDAVLVLGASGTVRFQRSHLSGVDLSPEEARSLSDSFLSDRRLGPPGMQYDYLSRVESGQYMVYYCQQHRGRPVYGGGITVRVQGDRVRGYQQLWYNALGYTGRARAVIPASQAISANVQRISAAAGEEKAAIIEVTLGYYAGMSSDEEWTADPVWRLRLENGALVFINAFTGAIEWPL